MYPNYTKWQMCPFRVPPLCTPYSKKKKNNIEGNANKVYMLPYTDQHNTVGAYFV
jgi:hypothetical protein